MKDKLILAILDFRLLPRETKVIFSFAAALIFFLGLLIG